MRNFGMMLVAIGIIWGAIAFNMNTVVETEGQTIGSGEYSVYIPSQQVHNLALADRRKNHLMFSGFLLVIGSMLFGFGTIQNTSATSVGGIRKCPFCAEAVNIEAVKCRFCGENLPKIELLKNVRALNVRKDYDANLQNGKYTIWQAVSMGDIDLVAQIIESGADINIRDGAKQTALDIAKRLGYQEIEGLLRQYGGKYSNEIK